jgi:hypothetical protein
MSEVPDENALRDGCASFSVGASTGISMGVIGCVLVLPCVTDSSVIAWFVFGAWILLPILLAFCFPRTKLLIITGSITGLALALSAIAVILWCVHSLISEFIGTTWGALG